MTYDSETDADSLAGWDPFGELLDPCDVIGGLPDDDFEGWFSFAVRSVGKAAKSVSRAAVKATGNPVVKWGLRGVAIAVPAAAPGVASLELARAAYKHASSAIEDAARGSMEAKRAIKATVDAAKRGDRAAQRGVEALKVAAKAHKAKSSKATLAKVAKASKPKAAAALPSAAGTGTLLLPDGTQVPVTWRRG